MKAVISMKGKCLQKELDVKLVYGKKIGDKVDGSVVGLENYELQITGGSDKQGFPMKKGVSTPMRKKFVLTDGIGYNPKDKGIRRRKSIRGEVISDEVAQINLKVLKEGKQKFDDFFKKEEPAAETEKPEEKK